MADPTIWAMVCVAASAVAVAALGVLAASAASRTPSPDGHPNSPDLPVWLRLCWPGARSLAPALARVAPQALQRHVEKMLAQSAYAGRLTAAHWLALVVVLAAVLAVVGGVGAALVEAGWPRVIAGVLVAACLGALWPSLWLHDHNRARSTRIARELPFVLDLVTLCVEAGLNLPAALQQATERSPAGPLRDELALALSEIRAGSPRMQALRALAVRAGVPGLRSVVAALAQAEALGMAIAPVLRAQADAQRSQRFARAEQRAQQAPVKLLLPLVACIFPCTFLIIGFPILVRLLAYV